MVGEKEFRRESVAIGPGIPPNKKGPPSGGPFKD
jgi:hypothetical protein